jgi:hypothetical protein
MKESTKARSLRQKLELSVFIQQLRNAGNTVFLEHHLKVEGKRNPYRFDIAMPRCDVGWGDVRTDDIAIEIEGLGLGHQGTKAFRDNIFKYGEAFAQGWEVLRVTWKEIGDGTALSWLERRGVSVTSVRGKTPVEGE